MSKPVMARKIRTEYYNLNSEIIKVNKALHPRSAVLRALDHIQMDDYGARSVSVTDEETGALHALMMRTPKHVNIIFKRDPRSYK
jgi:hypothetical protein